MARTILQTITHDYEIIGYPRLVRLNPNIPWKTRGNGALCLHIGQPGGKIKRTIGMIDGVEVHCSLTFTEELTAPQQQHLETVVKTIIETQARVDDENTNPGYVLLQEKPEPGIYTKAVTQLVSLEEIYPILTTHHARYQGYKNCRGLIGATAAVAWEPLDKTFELIAYRSENRWGTKRQVSAASVQQMDTELQSTFDNYDSTNHHNRIVPNSPCPILYGIRGDDDLDLIAASDRIDTEPVDSWLLFETNQGTDDHLQQHCIADVHPFESVIIRGSVDNTPYTITGGHVLFTLKDHTGTIPCAAYEPTKEFRTVVRQLHPGDLVEVYGGVREQPLTVNLEKLNVLDLALVMLKTENPVCPVCGKHMKSKGTNQGYKCITCGVRSDTPTLRESQRLLNPGFYEVPVCARRHLSKPLRRMAAAQPSLLVTST